MGLPLLRLVSHNYAPEPTGIGHYNTAMAEWFAAHGWRVEVLTGLPHYPWWRVPIEYAGRDCRNGRGDEVINGVLVRRISHFVPSPPAGWRGRARLDVSYLAAWWRRTGMLEGRPDVIVGVAPPFLIGGLLLRMRRRWHAPIVYHVQDLQVDAALDLGMLPTSFGWPLRAVESWLLQRADLVTACGRGMVARLGRKTRLRQAPRHWPNWTDCTRMRQDADSPPAIAERRRLLGDGSVVGLYSGSLGRKQGLEMLVAATAKLSDLPGWRTVVVGDGVERAELEASAANLGNIAFQELRPAERLAALLSAADIHIITQRREAADLVLPSKLLNILAVGRPVVVTAAPGSELHDVVIAAGCGLVVPPDDPEALAIALRQLAANAELRQTMGRAGRLWVERHADIGVVLGRVAGDLRELINRSH